MDSLHYLWLAVGAALFLSGVTLGATVATRRAREHSNRRISALGLRAYAEDRAEAERSGPTTGTPDDHPEETS